MFPGVTGDQALAELLDVSEDVIAAVILDGDGRPKAATVGDAEAAKAAEIAAAMLAYGDALRTGVSAARLEAVTADGNVFALREGKAAIVAATGRGPVAGLVLHDLRMTLRNVGRRTKAKADASA
jgi:predicted regulator of Ras-like GTPase activity (Roadblock/LC7/MglB family)